MSIAEMYFSSSLVALVGAGLQPTFSARRLQLWNPHSSTALCDLSFVTAVCAVKLNHKRLVVVLESTLHIYDLSDIKLLHSLESLSNPKGLCGLSPSDRSILVYPGRPCSGEGSVAIYDALSLSHLREVNAHQGALAAIALNFEGTMLATASEKGTVIRVHSVQTGERQAVLRRGTYPAQVYFLSFSLDSRFLTVSSDSGTCHVFQLNQPQSPTSGLAKAYLPVMLNDMWEPVRANAFAKLPPEHCASPFIATVIGTGDMRDVIAITFDGHCFVFKLDQQRSAECILTADRAIFPKSGTGAQ